MSHKFMRIAAAVIMAALAGLAASQLRPSESRQTGSLEYELPDYQQFTKTDKPLLAVSRDGKQFAYCTSRGIYLCSGTPLVARLISGTGGAPTQPFFSPDGNWIGYRSDNSGVLWKIPIAGGNPIPLRGITGSVSGIHWFAADSIVYSRYGGSIEQVSPNGKNSKTLFNMPSGLAVYPQILPDGDSLLYTETQGTGVVDAKIVVRSLKSGKWKIVCQGYGARYLANGRLVYRTVDKSVLAVPFDLGRLEVTGKPTPILQSVWDNGAMQYAISDTGTLVYIPDDSASLPAGQFNLAWVNRDGKEEPIATPPNAYTYVRISPDGTRAALTVKAGNNRSIWIWDFSRKTMVRLTTEADASNPLWTLDGRDIVYQSSTDGVNSGVFRKAADGTGEVEKLASATNNNYFLYWSKDGKQLTLLPVRGGVGEYPPRISPDGNWVAYWSNESGRNEVYVRPFPDINKGQWLISQSGGNGPLWSPDGRELFYRDAESVIALPIETGPDIKLGKPKALFWKYNALSNDGKPNLPIWDISPDGKRFLMVKPVQPLHRIHVIANWLELIRNSRFEIEDSSAGFPKNPDSASGAGTYCPAPSGGNSHNGVTSFSNVFRCSAGPISSGNLFCPAVHDRQ
jgi:eukaryotic-like serine/threonine-protein kinase